AVTPGRPLDELAVLVAERDGHAVHLQLDDVAHRLARVEPPADPRVPLADLVVVIGVLDREHRDGVGHRLEAGARLAADPPGRAPLPAVLEGNHGPVAGEGKPAAIIAATSAPSASGPFRSSQAASAIDPCP